MSHPRLLTYTIIALLLATPVVVTAQETTQTTLTVSATIDNIPSGVAGTLRVHALDPMVEGSIVEFVVVREAEAPSATATTQLPAGHYYMVAFLDADEDDSLGEEETYSFATVDGCPDIHVVADLALGIDLAAPVLSPVCGSTGALTATGRVLDFGEVAAGVEVAFLDATSLRGEAETASDGTFSVSGLPAGTYSVYLYRDAPYAFREIPGIVVDEAHLAVGDLHLGELRGGTVSGTLLLDGAPVAYADIAVWSDASSASSEAPSNDLSFAGWADSAPDGSYIVTGLADGTYHIHISGEGFATIDERDALVIANGAHLTYSPALATGGSIVGVVTRGAGGAPVEGIAVSAWSSTGGWGWGVSDTEGRYELTGLSAGTYNLYADAATVGLLSQGVYVVDGDASSGVPIVLGQTTTRDIALSAGATVTGRVLAAGAPVVGAWVSFTNPDWNAWSYGGSTTDAQGVFTISGLRPGPHTLDIYPSGALRPFTGEFVVAEGSSSLADLTLETGRTLRGRILGAGGAPLANVPVYAHGADASTSGDYTLTGSDGVFLLLGLLAEPHTLTIDGSALGYDIERREVSLVGGNVDLEDVSLQSVGSIRGRVLANGAAVANAWVSAYDARTSRSEWTQTQSDGTFVIHVPAGTYSLSIFPAQDAFVRASVAGVTVTSGQESTVPDVTLASGRTLRGVVRDPNGAPVQGAWLGVWGTAGWGYATTDAQGAYEIAGLGDGAYDGWLAGPSTPVGATYASRALTNAVTIAGGDQTLDLAFASAIALTGRVTTAQGGVAGATVYAWSDAGSGIAETAADGAYSIAGLPPGVYTVQAWSVGHAVEMATCDTTAGACDLQVGGSTAYSVTGTVTVDGAARDGLTVVAVCTQGNEVHTANTLTLTLNGVPGSYAFSHLEPCAYTVKAIAGANDGQQASVSVTVVDANVVAPVISIVTGA